jgi:transcriptional regulator with XRE-family HTH domain
MLSEARARLAMRMQLLRNEAQMSQETAAARAGMDRRNWIRIERQQVQPRLDSLLGIQYALGVDSLEALFGETTGDLFGRDAIDARHQSGDAP